MANSIVYEHGSIGQEGLAGSYRLVQANGQVISVSTDFIGNPVIVPFGRDYEEITYEKPTNIIITNLDTGKEIMQIPTKLTQIFTRQLEVFMYLPDILFVGFADKTDYRVGWLNIYKVWQIDLVNLTVNKYFELPTVRSIYPVGNQYFIIEPTRASSKSKVYPWNLLVQLNQLDKLGIPVFQINPGTQLTAIDWKSSTILHFSNCAFMHTQNNSKQIDFLNKAFELVVSLNVSDLFPNYQPVPMPPDLQNPNYAQSYVMGNNNCLLYWEYQREINKDYLFRCLQSEIIYCWNFTTNTQVYFPSYSMAYRVQLIIPFSNSTNQVKYFAEELGNEKYMGKVYESI